MSGARRLAALALVGLASGPAGAQPGVHPPSGVVLSRMTFVGSRGAANEVVIEAERARIPSGAKVAFLEAVRAWVSGQGEGSFEMTCDRAEYRIASHDLLAEGHVRGRTGDGRRLSTAKLRYRHATGVVATDVPVLIIDDSGRYRGGGFEYRVREGRFRLVRGASVVQQP